MSTEFQNAGRQVDWLSWIGQPMIYDGSLCVNRSIEDCIEHNKHPTAKLTV